MVPDMLGISLLTRPRIYICRGTKGADEMACRDLRILLLSTVLPAGAVAAMWCDQ